MASRRGAGKVRHIDTGSLWLQKAVYDKRLRMCKILGTENEADLGTKVLDGTAMWYLLKKLGFERRDGRSKLALAVAA
jgi:hypothetical protein